MSKATEDLEMQVTHGGVGEEGGGGGGGASSSSYVGPHVTTTVTPPSPIIITPPSKSPLHSPALRNEMVSLNIEGGDSDGGPNVGGGGVAMEEGEENEDDDEEEDMGEEMRWSHLMIRFERVRGYIYQNCSGIERVAR